MIGLKKNSLGILLLVVWGLYWVITPLIPLKSLTPYQDENAFSLELLFVSMICFVSFFLSLFDKSPPIPQKYFPEQYALLIPSLLTVSLLGFIAIFFDLVFIQGIDYSAGVAAARHQWHQFGLERGGVSSPFSVLGHLMFSFVYVAEVLLIVLWEAFQSNLKKCAYALTALILVLCFSLATGGRTALLTLAGFFMSAVFIRLVIGRPIMFKRPVRFLLFGSCLALILISYSAWIFAKRAHTSGLDLPSYTSALVSFSGGRLVGNDILLADNTKGNLKSLILAVSTYLIHSRWTFEELLSYPTTGSRTGSPLFIMVEGLFARLHLVKKPFTDWSKTGLFLSLPGSLWYEFGTIGLLFSSLLLGILTATASRLLNAAQISFLGLTYICVVSTIIIFSPLIFFSVLIPAFHSHFAFCLIWIFIKMADYFGEKFWKF